MVIKIHLPLECLLSQVQDIELSNCQTSGSLLSYSLQSASSKILYSLVLLCSMYCMHMQITDLKLCIHCIYCILYSYVAGLMRPKCDVQGRGAPLVYT